MTPERLGLLWGITVYAGAFARLFSSFTGFPSVVILLLSGLFIGRSGLGLVEPLDLGQGLETIVGLLVCLVLFEGGLNLKLPEGNIRNTVLKISLVRLFISLSAGIFIAHRLAGLSWQVAGIYSAIVLATGPTVGSPLVEQIKLASPLSEDLKAEGLLLEPIGAVLALLLLELTLGDLRGINDVFIALMQRLGGGVLIGLSAGWLLSEILKKMKSDPAVKNEFNSSNESLEKYGIDLTQSARDGILDPVIGRDEEIRRTIQILSRRTKNNPVLIGEPGVG